MIADTRLIERWLPIGEIGVESTRERAPMTPFPAPNRLHVWWARRPLVASRAAILASLLPFDADRVAFLQAIGVHGDPVAAKARLAEANREGKRLTDGFGYGRAFQHPLSTKESEWVERNVDGDAVVLDPTAGGGSLPFEAIRLGLEAKANDVNSVATLIEHATVNWPRRYASALVDAFEQVATAFVGRAEQNYEGIFPGEPEDTVVLGYLYARTITCPYCTGIVPLSPNWRLEQKKNEATVGVRLVPELGEGPGSKGRVCDFEVVERAEQAEGTVARGDGLCPYSDCEKVIDAGVEPLVQHRQAVSVLGLRKSH